MRKRHYLAFSRGLVNCLERTVEDAIAKVPIERFRTEPTAIAALSALLYDRECQSGSGYVKFGGANFDPYSAEGRYGADFSIIAKVRKGSFYLEKAILFQAKSGDLTKLHGDNETRLQEQCKKMLKVTRGPKILEISGDRREWSVVSARGYLYKKKYQRIGLAKYLVTKVITTLHGDTRKRFVEEAGKSIPSFKLLIEEE